MARTRTENGPKRNPKRALALQFGTPLALTAHLPEHIRNVRVFKVQTCSDNGLTALGLSFVLSIIELLSNFYSHSRSQPT